MPKPLPLENSNITGVPQAAQKIIGAKNEGQQRSLKHKSCQNWGTKYKNWKNVGKNGWKSTKMSAIREKMGNPVPFGKGNGTQPTQHGKLWGPATNSPKYETHIMGPSGNLSFGLLPKTDIKALFLFIQIMF